MKPSTVNCASGSAWIRSNRRKVRGPLPTTSRRTEPVARDASSRASSVSSVRPTTSATSAAPQNAATISRRNPWSRLMSGKSSSGSVPIDVARATRRA